MSRVIITVLLLLPTLNGWSQGINYASKYDQNLPLRIQSKVVYGASATKVFLSFYSADSLTDYEAILDFRTAYTDTSSDSTANLFLENAKYSALTKTGYLNLVFNNSGKPRVLVLQFIHKRSASTYYFDVPLNQHQQINMPALTIVDTLTGFAVCNNYLNTSHAYTSDISAYVKYYPTTFTAALPPMAIKKNVVAERLPIDSTFRIVKDLPFELRNEGLYFFESDTANLLGDSFFVADNPFPKYSAIKQLVPPMVYITTTAEFSKLKEQPTKDVYEQVWLGIVQSASKAKGIIKNYYNRVGHANVLFSNYKEGWKTDRGMIYVIFGLPTEVYKYGDREEWIYAGTAKQSKLKFTFAKIDNVHSDNHYVLARKSDYKTAWMNKVDLWRKGLIDGDNKN